MFSNSYSKIVRFNDTLGIFKEFIRLRGASRNSGRGEGGEDFFSSKAWGLGTALRPQLTLVGAQEAKPPEVPDLNEF